MLWTCCCIFCTCLILEFYGIPSNQGFLSLASALQLKDVQDIEGSPQLDSLFLNRPCTLCMTNWIIKYFLLHFYSWWSKRRELKKEFKPSDSEVKHVRILLVGPVGSRKSSFINSVNTVFQGYKNWTSKFSNTGSRCVSSFQYKTYNLRFIMMGLEEHCSEQVQANDIVSVLQRGTEEVDTYSVLIWCKSLIRNILQNEWN